MKGLKTLKQWDAVCLLVCICVSVIEDSQKTGAISSELEVPVLQLFLEILQIDCPYFKQYLSAQK